VATQALVAFLAVFVISATTLMPFGGSMASSMQAAQAAGVTLCEQVDSAYMGDYFLPHLDRIEIRRLAAETLAANKAKMRRDETLDPVLDVYVDYDGGSYNCSVFGVYQNGKLHPFTDFYVDDRDYNDDAVWLATANFAEDGVYYDATAYKILHQSNTILIGDEAIYVYSKKGFVGRAHLTAPPFMLSYNHSSWMGTSIAFDDPTIALDSNEEYYAYLHERPPLQPRTPKVTDKWGSISVDLFGDGKLETAKFVGESKQVPAAEREEAGTDADYYDPILFLKVSAKGQTYYRFAGNKSTSPSDENGTVDVVDLDGDGKMEFIANLIYVYYEETDIIGIENGKLQLLYKDWVSLN